MIGIREVCSIGSYRTRSLDRFLKRANGDFVITVDGRDDRSVVVCIHPLRSPMHKKDKVRLPGYRELRPHETIALI